jgi:nucleoside recognition membrane protein YjiH
MGLDTRVPRGLSSGFGLPSCNTSGCGLLLMPFMLAAAVLLVLLAMHVVAFVYTQVTRLWLLLGLPTVSGEGLPGALQWAVRHVNWGGVLLLGLLGLWWFGRRRR